MKHSRIIIWACAGILSLAVIAAFGLRATGSGQAQEGSPLLQYPTFPPTPTIAPAPPSGPAAAGANVRNYSFDSADTLKQWNVIDVDQVLPENRSIWTVQDGALVQARTGDIGDPSIQETMAVTGDANWNDYTITTKVYDQKNATFGLVARFNGNSYYRYSILADKYPDTPKQVLEKVVNGVATPLKTLDSPGYKQREWHTVSMSVIGSQIRVTLDGKVVAEATDAELKSGQAGVYTRALGNIRFDDISIAVR